MRDCAPGAFASASLSHGRRLLSRGRRLCSQGLPARDSCFLLASRGPACGGWMCPSCILMGVVGSGRLRQQRRAQCAEGKAPFTTVGETDLDLPAAPLRCVTLGYLHSYSASVSPSEQWLCTRRRGLFNLFPKTRCKDTEVSGMVAGQLHLRGKMVRLPPQNHWTFLLVGAEY